jgi:hypothetical protein
MQSTPSSLAGTLASELKALQTFGRDLFDATKQVFTYNRYYLYALAAFVAGILWATGFSPVTILIATVLALVIPPFFVATIAYAFIRLLLSTYGG